MLPLAAGFEFKVEIHPATKAELFLQDIAALSRYLCQRLLFLPFGEVFVRDLGHVIR